MEWISVKDELPKNEDDVLVHYHPFGWLPEIFIGFLEGGKWISQEGLPFSSQESLTHWMPLPEPPKY